MVRRAHHLFLLLIMAGGTAALASPLNQDMFTNHFYIHLGQKDRGTLYLMEDGSFEFLAAPTNVDYVHNCGGFWRFSEKTRILKIRAGNGCRLLSGSYSTSHEGPEISLTHPDKSFTLRKF